MTPPAVSVQHLSYCFAGRQIPSLDHQSFDLPRGSWTLVAGQTGSGKSTLLRALCGLIPHHTAGTMSGTVKLFGRSTHDTTPAKLAGDVGLVLQSPDDQICASTVEAEMAFGLENLAVEPGEIGRRIKNGLQRVGLQALRGSRTHQLSGGQKQKLMLGAILAMQPRLLLLDEPLSQLDPISAGELLEQLRELRQAGLTLVMVEHRFDELLSRADSVLTLRDGKLLAVTSTKDEPAVSRAFAEAGLRLPEVARLSLAMEGKFRLTSANLVLRPSTKTANMPNRPTPHEPKSENDEVTVLHVQELAFRYSCRQPFVWQRISFQLKAGERMALVGANGSGKSTLLAVLAGLLPPSKGTLLGTCMASTDRRGLLLQQPDLMLFCRTVRQELAFGPRQLGLSSATIQQRIGSIARWLSLGVHLDLPPHALSQGERLRVALAATLTLAPQLLLLDEPTTGQDQCHVDAIMQGVCQGSHDVALPLPACVLFSTHDLRTVCTYAQRVLVLAEGSLAADCTPAELVADEALLASAGLRRTGLLELRHRLALEGWSVEALAAELNA